ncbi:hypothetical protein F4860DRAFT_40324 [Xylaria cubensis]|nr:hypothetical protein F4860DRAFT_40324 [Xylaria cubensis]
MDISMSPVRAYVEVVDEDGNVIPGTERQYARPPGASTRSPMIGVHAIINTAEQDRTQSTSLLKHVTISRDNTASKNERKSASFAYLGSRLRSCHNTCSRNKTTRRTLPSRAGLSTILTSSLETPTGEHKKGFSDEHKPSQTGHGSSVQSTKGRKRKNKDSIDSSSSSRKQASKSAQAAEAAAAAKAAEQPLIDEWYQHQKALQSYLQAYSSPDVFDHVQDLDNATDHMEAMGKISRKLHQTKKSVRDTYQRSYGHHSS